MSPTVKHFRLDQVLDRMDLGGKPIEPVLDDIARIIHRYTDRLERLNPASNLP